MAEFIVTTLFDEEYDGTEGTLVDGDGLSLREALGLAQANGTDTPDTIVFDPSLSGTITLNGTQLEVASDVIIDGDVDGDDVADITIDANGAARAISVTGEAVTLDALIITGGDAGSGFGGGVHFSATDGVIRNSVITGNAAAQGGGIFNGGKLLLTDTTVSDNTADDFGGGLQNGSQLFVTNVTFSGNASAQWGGGLYNGAEAVLVNVTASGNTAANAGGIGNASNDFYATNVTSTGNSAETWGGGFFNGATDAVLTNLIVAGNVAGVEGDDFFGVSSFAGINIVGDTLSDDDVAVTTGIALTDVFASTVTVEAGNSATGVAFDAGELAGNGGPVETIALNRDLTNPALEAGDADALDEAVLVADLNGDGDMVDVIDTDTRGFARDVDFDGVGGTPDLGAFEAQLAEAFVVTTLSDTGDDFTVTGDLLAETADGGGLSLREAILLANADPTNLATITFDAALTGGDTAGVDDGVITLNGAQLEITSDVIIDGDIDGDDVADITIDANAASRVFSIDDGAATLDALVITGGDAGTEAGGGILADGTSILTIENSVVTGNVADGNGGGMQVSGTLYLNNATVSNNAAGGFGGGILAGTMYLTDVAVTGNTAGSNGGGVHNGGYMAATNVTLSGNTAEDGGGLANGGYLTLTNVTAVGNTASDWGGGIFNGGYIAATNLTVTGNFANEGGGVWSGGVDTWVNSIFAGNAANAGDNEFTSGGTTNHLGLNIVGDTLTDDGVVQQSGIALTDIFADVDANPDTGVISGLLADNGGSVETVALSRDLANPALDASETVPVDETVAGVDINDDGDTDDIVDFTPVTDARGFARDVDFDGVGGTPDLGAFEAQLDEAFVVTTLLDIGDDFTVTGDLAAETADGGGLSLREALILANADPTNLATITFDASLTGGSTVGVDDGVITLDGAQLEIASDVSIDGDIDGDGVADITIDADGGSRVVNITGGDVTLNALVVTGGDAGSGGLDFGGGIRVEDAALMISNAVVTENEAGGAAGIAVDSYATLVTTNTVVSNNNADFGGGVGITGFAATATLIDTTVSGNSATSFGGGILLGAYQAEITLINSAVSDNHAGSGGGGIGVGASEAVMTATNTTVSGNTSDAWGGGIANGTPDATVVLTNTTVSGNSAADFGGGMNAGYGGPTTIVNSIIAGNSAGDYGDDLADPGSTLSGGNIIGDTLYDDDVVQTTGLGLADIFDTVVTIDAGSSASGTAFDAGERADNGGPVETIALNRELTNPALEAGDATQLDEATVGLDLNGDGDTADIVDTDARGFARDVDFDGVGGTPDLGAFEAQLAEAFVVTTLSDTGDDFTVTGDLAAEMADGGGLSLREAILLANADPTNLATITFDAALTGGSTAGVDDGVITLDGAQLEITGDVSIDGDVDGDDVADITLDAVGASRVVNIGADATVALSALTITGGDAGSNTVDYGGGIKIGFNADLTLTNAVVTGNEASGGGGIYFEAFATLTASNTVISDNAADLGGGVFVTLSSVATFTDATISGNSADGGGGIVFGGPFNVVTLANSTVSNNTATSWGGGIGIGAANDTLILTNTTVSGNSAGSFGGGIENSSPNTVLTLTNATVSGNSAGSFGGGLNTGSPTTFANSIVTGNHSLTGSNLDGSGAFTYTGGNIIGDTLYDDDVVQTTGLGLADIFDTVVTIDAGSSASGTAFDAGELADNGGPVETILIAGGGAAHNVGDNTLLDEATAGVDFNNDGDLLDVIDTDARGENRIANATVDLGAVEVANAAPVAEDDGFATTDVGSVNGNVVADNGNGPDDDVDSLTVTLVNGAGFTPGVGFVLASGALLTMNADGTFTWDPNGAFEHLPVGVPDQDTFTYEIDDGFGGTDTATVTIAITGLDNNDVITGTPGKDKLNGGVGDDIVIGEGGKDKLIGDDGDDILVGGGKKDVLKGKSGNDTFVFDTKLKNKHADKIKDFQVNKDTIFLDEDIFKKVGTKLDKKEFEVGPKADDKKDYIIYDKSSGNLYYDKDGKGGKGQVKIAKLDKGLNLDHKDFDVGDFAI